MAIRKRGDPALMFCGALPISLSEMSNTLLFRDRCYSEINVIQRSMFLKSTCGEHGDQRLRKEIV
ncbi:hypothetical protein [Veronia pacifica]|uniref:hypothetical protein n=1 Tax=Veronia pacifica TaxID=1080227 RepID=UPI001586F81D|nr:hypothetical protein [Veronia pacifica]